MTAWLLRRWWASQWRTDVVVAAVLTGLALVEVWLPAYAPGVEETPGPRAVLTGTAVLATAPVVLRRRIPVLALTLVLAGTAAQARLATPVDGLAELAAMLVCSFSVGRHCDRTNASLAGVLAAVLIGVTGENAGDWAFSGLLVTAGFVAGLTMRRLQRVSDDLRARTRELAQERDQQARLAAEAERRRIARDMHDIVAHSVSTMVIQAQAGSALLADEPDRARSAFESVEAGGRQALTELRNLLGMLRDLDNSDTLQPQPTIDRLLELIDNARRTGLGVDLVIDGDVVPVSPGLGLAVYRIVQEGLTNTIKHAGATHASVRVRYCSDAVELELTDNGTSSGSPQPGGHGLVGMRERAAVYHGSVVAGPRPEGGFLVRVRLPLELAEQ